DVPGQGERGQDVVVFQRCQGAAADTGIDVVRVHRLCRVLVAYAEGAAQPGGDFAVDLQVGAEHLERGVVGGLAGEAGGFLQPQPALAQVVVGEQVVGALVREVVGQGGAVAGAVTGEVPELARPGVAVVVHVRSTAAQRHVALDRQPPGDVDAAAGDLVVDLAEAGVVLLVAHRVGPVALAFVAEADHLLVGDVTLRLCPGRAPLDLEVAVLAELVRAADLVVDHLALEPAGVVPAVAVVADVVHAGAAAGFLERVVHVQGGEVDPVVPPLVAGAEQRVDAGVVAGGKELVVVAVGERFQVGTEEYALLL